MPTRPARLQAELDRIGAERFVSEQEVERSTRRAFFRGAAGCVFWGLLGAMMMGEGMHVTDLALGRIWFVGGQVVGYGGILYTLLRVYWRGKARGDWD